MSTRSHFLAIKIRSAVVIAGLGLAFTSLAQAATYTVNSTADAPDANPGDGVCDAGGGAGCTLRAALQQAANGDTINFSVTGTIAPTSALPVTTSVTINGPGATALTIDGGSQYQLFNVNGIGINVAISGLNLINAVANQGAAIQTAGAVASLTVTGCTFSSNFANSNGGAISNETNTGTLSVSGCTFSDNGANRQGGAIYNPTARAVTLLNSTFLRNNAAGSGTLAAGGAFYHQQDAGQFNGDTIPVTITGCAFTNNSAGSASNAEGGAIYYRTSGGNETITISNSSFTSNTNVATFGTGLGGAIFANAPRTNDPTAPGATISISNTTFTTNATTGNSQQTVNDVGAGGAIYVAEGGAAISSSSFDGNTAKDNNNPRQSSSSKQAQGGAIFYSSADPFGLTLTDCTLTNNSATAVNQVAAGGALYLSNSTSSQTGVPLTAPVVITRTTMTGNTLSGGTSGPTRGGAFFKNGAGPVTVNDSTISTNTAAGAALGGGIHFAGGTGPLTMSNTTMDGNIAGVATAGTSNGSGRGGALYLQGGTMNVTGSRFTNNRAVGGSDGYGGGIHLAGGTATITSSTLSGNSVVSNQGEARGGGVEFGDRNTQFSNTATVRDSTISNNTVSAANSSGTTVDGTGGGISIAGTGNFQLVNSTVTANSATSSSGSGNGGGIYQGSAAAVVNINNSTIARNAVSCTPGASCGQGGGIFTDNSAQSFTVANTIIALNTAGASGPDVQGNFASSGYNLVGIGNGSTGFTSPGDQIGTTATPIDPKLGTLANNGGATLTLALLTGSPAIDAGNPAFDGSLFAPALTTDQHGRPRVRNGRIDIGAYEAPATPTITSPVNNARTNGTPTFAGTGEAGDTLTLTITGASGTVTITTTVGTDGKFSVASPMLADGSYSVTATEAFGGEAPSANSISVNFTVDTIPPVISNVPANIVAEATGPNGSVVNYTNPTANDNIDGSVPVTCAPASGSTFALGTTMVTCSASDQVGNTSHASFNVTVRDTTGPAFSNLPTNIVAEATGPNGAAVSYTPPTANDAVSGSVAVSCTPASGATFALGTTTVTCSAADQAGNRSQATFTVKVQDTTAPTISNVPADITTTATDSDGAVVTYTSPTARDAVSGNVTVTCSPASGSKFPVGATTVTCSATDAAGNTATASFKVTVQPPASPTPTPTPSAAPAQPINISTRSNVGTGDNVMIAGFIITGTEAKSVVVRGIGPSSGVSGSLQDPVLELHGPAGFQTITNDNWQDASNASEIPEALQPKNASEAAILVTLQPGAYTGIVTGKNNTTGIALVEVYDVSFGSASQLANISTRSNLGAGDSTIIGGFILGGNAGTTVPVVVRGIGPSLTANGVQNALADPTVKLVDKDGNVVASNNNWQDDAAQAKKVSDLGLAPKSQLEAAIYATLAPGAYTAVLGSTGGTGIAVVEIYHVQ